MDKISVIVPIYNVEQYLKKCVKSIQNQTYKNLEIILVDDGSPDNCGKMCDEFAKEDNRIKVIHKENGGLSDARNAGIEIATGEYVTFIDSDDWVSEDYCQILYTALKETHSDVSTIRFALVVEKNAVVTNVGPQKVTIPNGAIVFEKEEILKQLLMRRTLDSYVWGKLYPIALIQKHKFKVGVSFEDVIYDYETFADINKIVCVDKEAYFYLKHSGTITATCSQKNLQDYINATMYRFNGVKEKGKEFDVYNYFALLEKIISISIKYVIANEFYEDIENQLQEMFELLNQFSMTNEKELTELMDDFQRLCLYLIRYNGQLFLSFLKERQKMKVQGKNIK